MPTSIDYDKTVITVGMLRDESISIEDLYRSYLYTFGVVYKGHVNRPPTEEGFEQVLKEFAPSRQIENPEEWI